MEEQWIAEQVQKNDQTIAAAVAPIARRLAPSAAQVIAARAEKCRKSFSFFVREAWKHLGKLAEVRLEWNWHHDALCDHLQGMAEDWAAAKDKPTEADQIQRIRNLLINIAPGTTKTLITLVFFPCWMWTRWPRWMVRCVSSNPRTIQDSSREARDIIGTDWYKRSFIPQYGAYCQAHEDACEDPECKGRLPSWARTHKLIPWDLRSDQDAMSDWANTIGGMRRTTGLKAPVTGEHVDWILCDDPHDAEQVDSLEERTNVHNKWDNALFNRVNDGRVACRVIVMQRLRVDDLAGHVLELSGKIWFRLIIASRFNPSNTFQSPIGFCPFGGPRIFRDPRKEPGELLDPVRFPNSKLDEELDRLTPRGFAAQHQQEPDADSTVAFKLEWWSWYQKESAVIPPSWSRPTGAKIDPPWILKRNRDGSYDLDWVCVSVDCSGGSEEETASAVGLLIVGGKDEKRLVLDDCTPGPRTFLDQVEDMKNAVARAVHITGKRSIRLLVEKKAYGGAAMEVINAAIKKGDFGVVDGRPVAVHVEAYELKAAMGNKEQRAKGMEPDHFSGVLYLPEAAPWLVPFLAEFKRFPAEPNDRVDTLVQVVERYRKRIGWAQAFKKAGK